MVEKAFVFVKAPEIHFGPGKIKTLPALASRFGNKVLLITSPSFLRTDSCKDLQQSFHNTGILHYQVTQMGEPTPDWVDSTVSAFGEKGIELVISIGGGSCIDAGKAVSAMLPVMDEITPYLEGFETKKHSGAKVPFIAVPTSSGTGAEATKNAVLSRIGENGFKRSLRHDNFVPDIALVDPQLALTCPPQVTAACGLDALTQLLEAYVSTAASPMTDALALSGLEHIRAGLMTAYLSGTDLEARSHMAYAALMSGIVLANAGLGVVHGFASPIGGFFDIPHGIVCGTLLGAAVRMNIDVILDNETVYKEYLEKYALAGTLVSGKVVRTPRESCNNLIDTLEHWIESTKVPTLGAYGVTNDYIPRIVDKTTNKNSPVQLNKSQLTELLKSRI